MHIFPTAFAANARRLTLGVFLIAFATSTPATAGEIVVGTPRDSNGNCFPFGCNYAAFGTGQYQQVYTNSLFSGPITITGLQFFVTNPYASLFSVTAMNTGAFKISLSTTSADWNTLSSTFANNIGGNNTQVFSGSLAQPFAFGDTLSITFSTPFTYTP